MCICFHLHIFTLFLSEVMIPASGNRGRKIYCAIAVFVGAACLFAWHLAVNGIQQEWLITLVDAKRSNDSQDTTLSLEERLLESARGLFGNLTKIRHSTNLGEIQEKAQSEPFPRKVLIISRGRSGSSFLGDLFNQNNKMFYLFEPMGIFLTDSSGHKSKGFKILDDLYQCKFGESLFLNFMLERRGFRRKSKKLGTFPGQCPRISRISQYCLSKILQSSCLRSSALVAKVLTHRLPQGGLWGIRKILDANQNLRIVHLLRDPRRVIASMRKAGWFKGKNFDSHTRYICSSIWENLKHVLNESAYYKNRYKIVVFSDMMLNPSKTVKELYDFLRMGPVPEYIFTWIKQNTEASKSRSKQTYRTARNSTEVLHRKVDFSRSEERIIDRHCGAVTRFINKIRKHSIV